MNGPLLIGLVRRAGFFLDRSHLGFGLFGSQLSSLYLILEIVPSFLVVRAGLRFAEGRLIQWGLKLNE